MGRGQTFVSEAWDRFLLYLPLACMAVLALGSYWVVRSTPSVQSVEPARVQRHDPDYFMDGFSVKTFDANGHMRSEVTGDKVRHYPDTQWLEIDGIYIRSFDAKGNLTTASADRGLTNEDGSEVQLMGHALVVRESGAQNGEAPSPSLQYRSEFLHAFMNTERLKSHKPVELQRGSDRFTADSLDFDNVEQVLQLQGRVRGTLVPKPQR
ncbi:LPS export ABC transporter periplasmic protein LptC [Rhodoferax lacus]|uniref:LPS export ABC transporter periplasmic protein LptC n=1 Tax=Rhodoferax lacus TaxID=2184758 RepID=A0A3E1RAT1_9BURK|nr:LPS export ABC transporter periplasmic protein LptC [Rhodoferax lacus]RFO96447.1 LPS export ABC transporter periplasmic protein LptC [Rhodoferax lacus]